jgi:hypothetical protein
MQRICHTHLLLIIVYMLCWTISDQSTRFIIYDTDETIGGNLWQHHCLLYYVADNTVMYDEPYNLIHQIIPYCLHWQSRTDQICTAHMNRKYHSVIYKL